MRSQYYFYCFIFVFLGSMQLAFAQSQLTAPPFSPASGDTIPADFPFNASQITISNNPAPGEIYLANFHYVSSPFGTFLMRLDNQGRIRFERRTGGLGAYDFTLQPNGNYSYFGTDSGYYYELDQNFVKRNRIIRPNIDYHELRILKNGNAIFLTLDTETVDMTQFGGHSDAKVANYIIREIGPNGDSIFEWKSKKYYLIADAIHEDLTAKIIDPVHINSLDFDTDGNLLVSARSLDEISKIDIHTGNFIWRMGGNHNQFTFTDTDTFDYQHDVRILPNGNITMFDNGTFRTARLYSRAVEYAVDQNARTLHKVWEYRHTPDIITSAMGSVQRLDNGNTLIGWGLNTTDSTALTEVKPDGSVALEITLPKDHFSYRVYKFLPPTKGVVESGPYDASILGQNYPNPVSTSSVINFSTTDFGQVSLILYDALGREVRNLFDRNVAPGNYSVKLDAADIPNGTYMYKLSTSAGYLVKRLIINK